MKVLIGSSSIVGGRDEQQDAVGWHHCEDTYLLAAVADGLGGHPGGAEAAQTAVAAACSVKHQSAGAAMASIRSAVDGIPNKTHTFSVQTHMTTCVLVLWQEGRDYVEVAWSGDSRLYARLPDGTVRQVTKDHGNGYMLFACLGDGHPNNFETSELPVRPGMRLLLCSDGVSAPFEGCARERFQELLNCTGKDLSEIASAITTEAVSLAGRDADNATALLVDFI